MSPSKTEPSVCAICLTADRPEMTRRAIESFRAQTYTNKRLLVYDTGAKPLHDLDIGDSAWPEWYAQRGPERATVGELRNLAATFPMAANADIIIHLDSDDFSHPARFAEQVAILQSSAADAVGYNEMLFWRDLQEPDPENDEYLKRGEAWLYRNPNPGYALGTSLCYWRRTWERKPFPAVSAGEDLHFCIGLKVGGVSAFSAGDPANPDREDPRMIARIHSGNTSTAYSPAKMERHPDVWSRAPEWDEHCAGAFA